MRPILITGWAVIAAFSLALLLRSGGAGCVAAQEPEPGVTGEGSPQPAADGARGRMAERFKQYDSNGDGVVSQEELGRPALFRKIDADADGLITAAEARDYARERRQGAARQVEQEDVQDLEDDAAVAADAAAATGALEGVKQYPNLRYAEVPGVDPKLLSLDVYAPAAGQGHPVMVMVHGGGWQKGDKAHPNIGPAKARFFVPLDFVFVSVNYRLSPGVTHPAHVQDVAAALAWIHENVGRYGGNPDALYVMGHSAGAHLAALVATDERYLAAHGKELTIIKGVIVNDSAGLDLPRAIDEMQGGKRLLSMYETAFGKDRDVWESASPARHIAPGKGIPPFLIFYHAGARGPLATLSEDFARALGKAGVPAKVLPAPGKDHQAMNADVGKPGDLLTDNILSFLNKSVPALPAPATGVPPAPGSLKVQ